MKVNYKVLFPIVYLVIITVIIFLPLRKKEKVQTPFTVSLDHIKMMRQLHLTRFYFEQIIPIEKKDRLKTLIIVPATIDAYMDLDELQAESDSLNYKFTLPEIRLSEVNFIVDSAKVYGFKHFGIYFSDNAYSEAVMDIQEGMRIARGEVVKKAREQGIETMALKEAKDFLYNWARGMTDKEVGFNEVKD